MFLYKISMLLAKPPPRKHARGISSRYLTAADSYIIGRSSPRQTRAERMHHALGRSRRARYCYSPLVAVPKFFYVMKTELKLTLSLRRACFESSTLDNCQHRIEKMILYKQLKALFSRYIARICRLRTVSCLYLHNGKGRRCHSNVLHVGSRKHQTAGWTLPEDVVLHMNGIKVSTRSQTCYAKM